MFLALGKAPLLWEKKEIEGSSSVTVENALTAGEQIPT